MHPTMKTKRKSKALADGVLAWLVVASPLLISCSVVIDTDPAQCATDADCAHFPGTVCIKQACVDPPLWTPGECESQSDCDALRGDHWVCRKPDGVCISLLSPECQMVSGDYTNDNAIFIGSLLPTKGIHQSSGRPIENAIRLAIGEFSDANNGLTDAEGTRHPLVLVGCDSGTDPIAASNHLVHEVGVPAIIGASFSGVTIDVATKVTIPADVLLISPSATSTSITHLQDNGLVWRTSPSDELQARAVQQLVLRIEAAVRSDLGMTSSEPIRLTIAHKGDTYGRGLTDSVEQNLRFNDKSVEQNKGDYLRVDYGDPDVPGTLATNEAVKSILSTKPHLILIFGTTEGVTDIFAKVEQQWSTIEPLTRHKPRYVFSDGGVVNELWGVVGNAPVRSRILGTVPGSDNDLFKTFRLKYRSTFSDDTSPDVFGASGGYDAMYLLAYSMVSMGVEKVSGPRLAQGIETLVPPGEKIAVGLNQINDTFFAIQSGKSVDFEGASGPLDFAVATGEASSDIQVWCLPATDGVAGPAAHSGLLLDASTGQLEGEIGAVCD